MIAFPWRPQYYISEYKSGYRLHKNGMQYCEPLTESLGCSYIMWREWGPQQTPEGRQIVNALVQKAMHQQKYAGSDWSDMTWVMSGHPHGCHKRTDQRVARHDPQCQMQLTNPTKPKEKPFKSMHWLPDHYGSYIKQFLWNETDDRQTGFGGLYICILLTCIHTYTHTYKNKYTYIDIRTYIQTDTYIHY